MRNARLGDRTVYNSYSLEVSKGRIIFERTNRNGPRGIKKIKEKMMMYKNQKLHARHVNQMGPRKTGQRGDNLRLQVRGILVK